MLSPRYLEGAADTLVDIYSQLETDILRDMARRIAKLGKVTDATDYQSRILAEAGGLRQNIAKILKGYDKKIIKAVQETYTEALKKNTANDNRIFKAATGRTVSDQSAQQTLATVQNAHNNLSRLTRTTAATSQQQFVREANRVFIEVQSGAFDYESATRHAVNDMAERGITTVQYQNGKPVTRTIEAAVRMNVLTGINNTAATITMSNCEDLGCDLVEVSAHIGARNRDGPNPWSNHEAWQGKIYKLHGSTDEYPNFYDTCGYGEADGICGINCRHSFYPYFEGAEARYSKDELDNMSDKEVEYNGQKMSQYEAEQRQRGIERNIRKYKRLAESEKAANLDNTHARQKIGEWQARARDFSKQTGLQREYTREYIGTKDGKQPAAVKPKIQHVFTQSQPINQSVVQKITDMNAKADTFYAATHRLSDFVTKAETTQTMTKLQTATIKEGKDLAGKLFVKRELKDINRVLSAQGFDGKPTVLGKEDFIQAVKDDTFIAQRTYTAPDKTTLDEYIDMLRNGDFYVDCRTGGRAHGKGMYAAADYTKGKDLRRVIDEMAHYQQLGAISRGEYYTMTETLTIDPSAKIIDEDVIRDEFIYKYTLNLKQKGLPINKINDKLISDGWLNRDRGVLAALMGYDVIRATPSPRRADYMVILNRTKLILLGGK
nr:MAG TPA: minor capsid protein [Caudoviricetes sp.]